MNEKAKESLNKAGNICLFVKENSGDEQTARYMAEAIAAIKEAVAQETAKVEQPGNVAISCQESAEKEYNRVRAQIAKKFHCPANCNCNYDKHDNCPAHNALVVAGVMEGVSRGSSWDWDAVFEWACMGRWEWIKQHGYRTGPDNPDEAFRRMEVGAK